MEGSHVLESVYCISCGYDLKGLAADGRCPECGTEVERSTRGELLQHASSEYVKKLHIGVFLVLTSIIFQVLMFFVGAVLSVGMNVNFAGGQLALDVAAGIIGIGLLLMLIYGWWLLSAPDPQYTGRDDGSRSRRWVRVTLVVALITGIAQFVWTMLFGPQVTRVMWVYVVISIIDLLVKASCFFVQMIYIRWLARRIPDRQVLGRAKVLIWLGPVLVAFGWILIGLGPLIALIMYWNMLDWVRKDLKRLRCGLPPRPGALGKRVRMQPAT